MDSVDSAQPEPEAEADVAVANDRPVPLLSALVPLTPPILVSASPLLMDEMSDWVLVDPKEVARP
jgi:hypothetical protein